MEWSVADRRLGMDRPITRRNFLDGVALGVGALAVNGGPDMVQAQAAVANPAGQTGLQGQTDAGRMVMHAVRDGSYWRQAGEPVPSGESYDLVVVGAGISGLTAAHQYRQQAGTDVKILILDPLEDFGGHATRNEFVASNGARLIGYCGMQSMQTPSYFSPAVNQVLADIGIEPARFETYFDQTWAEDRGLTGATFFASEH